MRSFLNVVQEHVELLSGLSEQLSAVSAVDKRLMMLRKRRLRGYVLLSYQKGLKAESNHLDWLLDRLPGL